MSAITFTARNFTGTPDDEDQRAARYLVRVENQRRAALDPPGTPLPTSTAAELKSSVLTVLSAQDASAWASYVQQAINDNSGGTPEQFQQIKASIRKRLDNGESMASILADVAS